ncbi:MAG: phosphonoacetaldehyde reductase [Kiritimatiellae bacterium]|nr:phosphonoacetaldehyde reductase [Kiritimatiellia bacterium]MDD4734697.1 phosphonoacetaldehyde reductase [Kiritimatiellia bacterium]
MNQLTHFGASGAEDFLEAFIQKAEGRILVVCREHSFHQSGVRDFLSGEVPADTVYFSDFSPNPKEEDVMRGVENLRSAGIRAVIAVGGGSAMDTAKLINFFGCTGANLDAFLQGTCPADVPVPPLLAIPTTSGSGSEATHFAVVYRGATKHSVDGPSMIPSQVLLVPEFTYSLSGYQTACTGMDALAQGVESLWAKCATDESRGYAREAVDLALRYLEAAVHAPNPENRSGMMRAANLAGQAINISKTTAPHAFSYILTATFGLPHGQAVGLLLPHFVAYHAAHGVTVEGVTGSRLCDLLCRIGLDRRLDLSANELLRLLEENVNQERLSNNPVHICIEMLHEFTSTLAK